MGGPVCCITFEILSEDISHNASVKYHTQFMGHILNSTILEGNDYITFFEGDFDNNNLKLIVGIIFTFN